MLTVGFWCHAVDKILTKIWHLQFWDKNYVENIYHWNYFQIPRALSGWPANVQITSECIYEIIDFPKYHHNSLIDFCPERFYRQGTCDLFWLFSRRLYSGECITYLVWITFQGQNLSNFFCAISENQWFHKYILTSSDL